MFKVQCSQEHAPITPKTAGQFEKNEGRGADIRFFFLFLWSDLTLWKNLKPKLFIINNKNYEEEPIQIGCLFGSGSPLGLSV